MGTLPALIGFQVPQMNLADTYTAMARMAAYDQARRTSLLEQEEKRAQRDRDAQARQLLADSIRPQPQVPGQGFAAAAPQRRRHPRPRSCRGGDSSARHRPSHPCRRRRHAGDRTGRRCCLGEARLAALKTRLQA